MHRLTSTILLGVLATGTVGIGAGCSNSQYSNSDQAMSLRTRASSDSIFAGETVTVLSWTQNTLSRNAKITWITTGGTLKQMDGDRTAQVMFDKPGTYSITGVLTADGKEVDRSTNTVEVKPLPGNAMTTKPM